VTANKQTRELVEANVFPCFFFRFVVIVFNCVILRCVIPVVCRKADGEVNIGHETTTMLVWIYDGI